MLVYGDEHSHRARRTKASRSRERWPVSSCSRRQHFNGKQRCKRTSRGSKRPGSYVADATIIVAIAPPPTEQSGVHASLADALPPPHPSFHPIHPSRVQRALLCARSWAGHWAPRSQSTGSVGSASLPSSCPGWVRQVRDFTAERSRKPKPIIPARGAAGGGRIWAAGSARLRGPGETRVVLRWLRRPLRRSPSRTLPSPARVEFGFCARGRRGYEGFESAQAAEWSSHLFPPPATGLNFCKFKLNGAFFCCLPEGA